MGATAATAHAMVVMEAMDMEATADTECIVEATVLIVAITVVTAAATSAGDHQKLSPSLVSIIPSMIISKLIQTMPDLESSSIRLNPLMPLVDLKIDRISYQK